MKSRVGLFGHSVFLGAEIFPAGLLGFSAILDVLRLAWPAEGLVPAVYWTMACGLLGALLAVLLGWMDWRALPHGSRARRLGTLHRIGNMIVTGTFAASWLLRSVDYPPPSVAVWLSLSGLAGLSAVWLGGELVFRLGVGVDPDAHSNAPNLNKRSGLMHADFCEPEVSEFDLDRFDQTYKAWKETAAAYEDAIRRMHAGEPAARKTAQDLARELARLQNAFVQAPRIFREPEDSDEH